MVQLLVDGFPGGIDRISGKDEVSECEIPSSSCAVQMLQTLEEIPGMNLLSHPGMTRLKVSHGDKMFFKKVEVK